MTVALSKDIKIQNIEGSINGALRGWNKRQYKQATVPPVVLYAA